jgi:signal transduction histidine kinase
MRIYARHPWLVEVTCVLVAAVSAVVNALQDWPVGPEERRIGVVVAVASALAAGLVPRLPLAGTIVQSGLILVAGIVSPYANPALVLALVSLGVLAHRAGWVPTVAGAACVYAALVVLVSVVSDNPITTLPGVVRLVSVAVLVTAPVAVGRYLAAVRSARRVAEERAAEVEARRVVEARAVRLAERTRLARDLHDILAHHIGAITLRASSARLALEGGNHAVAGAALADIAATGRSVLSELRGLLTILRDPDAVDVDTAEAVVTDPESVLHEAIERVRGSGVPVGAEVDPRLVEAPALVRATVARVASEALTNVLKHAGPGVQTTLAVDVTDSSGVRLRVVNAPRPASPGRRPALPSAGLGLTGMRERVALLGGALTAGPTADAGWSLTVDLPGPANGVRP